MKAEIISVGTELLLGQVINSDTAYVARSLAALGIDVQYSSIVGDNSERLTTALTDSFSRADLIVTTGGLGPTGDDLTKETCARLAGRHLVQDKKSLERLKEYFKGRDCGPNQLKQVMLPEGCTVLQNDHGTAPGCAFTTKDGKVVVMLPGPPSELVPMMENYAMPFLSKLADSIIWSTDIRVYGIGEGAAEERILDLTENKNPTVATYAATNEMYVRVTAKASTKREAQKLCKPMVHEICNRLGDAVYGIDVESLEEVVVKSLTEQKMTLATAESCTGGLVAKRITDIPGSSAVFHMGAVTYSNDIKTMLLGVPEELLRKKGAVCPEVAAAMAKGVREKAGADFGIGITGIAGPDGGTAEKPVGLIYIGLCDGCSTWIRELNPKNGHIRERSFLRLAAANNALDMLRRRLLGLPDIEVSAFHHERRAK